MQRVPRALREGLGDPATAGLIEFLDTVKSDWKADVTSTASLQFERRLVEEVSSVKVQMAQGFACVREEMARMRTDLSTQMAEQRAELLKWAFLFWVGQFFASASIAVAVIRSLR